MSRKESSVPHFISESRCLIWRTVMNRYVISKIALCPNSGNPAHHALYKALKDPAWEDARQSSAIGSAATPDIALS